MKFIGVMLVGALVGFLLGGVEMMVKGEIPVPFRRDAHQEVDPNKSWQEVMVIRWVHILQGGGAIYSYSAPMTRAEARHLTWNSSYCARAMFIPSSDPEFIKAILSRKSF